MGLISSSAMSSSAGPDHHPIDIHSWDVRPGQISKRTTMSSISNNLTSSSAAPGRTMYHVIPFHLLSGPAH